MGLRRRCSRRRPLPPPSPSSRSTATLRRHGRAIPLPVREQYLTLDFGEPREFGGLVLRWQPGMFASRYDVQFSDDGREWRTVRSVATGRGDLDPLLLPDAETRYVRLALHDGPARAYALAEVEVRDLAFGASHNAFFEAVAREFPRGYFPRGFSGQQSYWTIVGVDGGSDSGLLSEDGALEVARGGFSIEPFVRVDSRVFTWADVDTTQSLRDGYLPIPSVTWRQPRWTLKVTAFASGDRARSQLFATYEMRNLTDRPLSLELVLAIRPSQVNPPAQFLNAPSGVAPISEIAWKDRRADGEPRAHGFPVAVTEEGWRIHLRQRGAREAALRFRLARRSPGPRPVWLRLGGAGLSGYARAPAARPRSP